MNGTLIILFILSLIAKIVTACSTALSILVFKLKILQCYYVKQLQKKAPEY